MAVVWFFRVIEAPGAGWTCRRGRHELDDHVDLESALRHIRAVARKTPAAEVFLHYVDGRVLRLGDPGTTWPRFTSLSEAGPPEAEPEPA